MSKTITIKKVLKIVGNVFLYFFIAVALFGVVVSISAKKSSDGTATVFGYQMRLVVSGSMEKCDLTDVSKYKIKDIPRKSMVFIKTVPETDAAAEKWYSELKKGDVLTIRYSDEQGKAVSDMPVITHRIVSDPVLNENGGYITALAF